MHPDFSTLAKLNAGTGAIIVVVPTGPGAFAMSLLNMLATFFGAPAVAQDATTAPAVSAQPSNGPDDSPVTHDGGGVALACNAPEPARSSRRRGRLTPAEKAQQIFETEGDVSLDRPTWVARTGVSRRLLDRAIRLETIPTTRHGIGRENRRDLAKASDVAAVLAEIEAVRAGKVAPPKWFEAVIRPAGSNDVD